MAASIKTTCKSCGVEHDLCLSNADFFEPGARYQYACPRTGERIEFSAEQCHPIPPDAAESPLRVQRAH